MLESKQLTTNKSKSKYVIMAPLKSRTALLKEAEVNPIKMGETIIENLKSEEYLGNQIHKDWNSASIGPCEEILNIFNHPCLI